MAALLVAAAACEGSDGSEGADDTEDVLDLPDAEFRYHTQYVDIAPLSDLPMCTGTLERIDAHIESLSTYLELEGTARFRMYFSHPGAPQASMWCNTPGAAAACFRPRDRVIFTGAQPLPHELVHALAPGRSFWTEGIAYAFSMTPASQGFPQAWSASLGESGHLSRWIMDVFGPGTYIDLFERTPRGASQTEVEAATRDVLDLEFAELLSEYKATAPAQYTSPWACYVSPATVESPWVGDLWQHEAAFDCDASGTFNDEASDEARMAVQIPVTIPTKGRYQFIADHDEAELRLHNCSKDPLRGPLVGLDLWDRIISLSLGGLYLDPGPYVLTVSLPLGAPASVRLQGYLWIDEFPTQ